eukprot:TRINITY_DN2859_c0_g1_i1.p1 TRINITY_DN2859_c0_g1~~TRINITY_DN2859_c0_g1_i1.p1  ORF type:complete len:220 (+),score=26.11 TRINITY_DN2859_c0_g1_i1:88-660(+)
MAEDAGYDDQLLNGKTCYFSRDLRRGCFGGDVSCLQQFLKQEGHLQDGASGYFGPATEDALLKWQRSNGVAPADGFLGYSSRVLYARVHRIPTTEQIRALEQAAEHVSSKRCLVLECSGSDGMELCQRRCLTRDASYDDRMHLCQESCQMVTSEACDKAFPTSQSGAYKSCLSVVPKNCYESCKRTVSIE